MPAMSTDPKPEPKRQIWSDSQVAALTEGTLADAKIQAALQMADSRGMTPSTYAVLRAARQTDSLTALLALLEPPEAIEQTQIEKVLDLLETMAAAVIRIEQQQAVLMSRLAGPSVASPPPPHQRPGPPASPR